MRTGLFDLKPKPYLKDDGTIACDIIRVDSKENVLLEHFIKYLKWNVEGKKVYGKEQYAYDDYHNHIEHVEGIVYNFSIQIDDGPDGDTWWNGRMSVDNHFLVHIIEQFDRR